jgi:hypothetical protein
MAIRGRKRARFDLDLGLWGWLVFGVFIAVLIGVGGYHLLMKPLLTADLPSRAGAPPPKATTSNVEPEPAVRPCDYCAEPSSSFYVGHPGWRKCSRCDGTGDTYDRRRDHHKQCDLCFGLGERLCYDCNGTGRERR